MKTWKRNCPECGKEFEYLRESRWKKACNRNSLCKECNKIRTWNRNCPFCGKELKYKQKQQRDRCLYVLCRSCDAKKRHVGIGNPFYGRHHKEETKETISNFQKASPSAWLRKPEELMGKSEAMKGDKNRMAGRSVYSVWLEKYGEEEANRRQSVLSAKISAKTSGEKNPMFGKPTPQGSGNGWSGWYKGKYFRSLRELSYIVLVLEKNGKSWKSAESIKIPYENWDGRSRTYRPDFLVGNCLVEIKPTKLHQSPSVALKVAAARAYCSNRGMDFEITDSPLLDNSEIYQMWITGKIKFIARYEERFVAVYGHNH
jgi:hypothetical protein